jgi:cobalt/nickel transport system permease protein
MHINDGILPAPVCIAGYGLTGLATWFSLRQINRTKDPTRGIPRASMLTSAFFVASLIHIPVPPASVHLVLNGLLGCILGYYAFPAILVGLFLQAVMFGHGGFSTLGVNAAMMGIPALVAYYLFRWGDRILPTVRWVRPGLAFVAAAIGVGLAVLIFFGLTVTNLPAEIDAGAERTAIATLVVAHLPAILLEGLFAGMLVAFLDRVKPELLEHNG